MGNLSDVIGHHWKDLFNVENSYDRVKINIEACFCLRKQSHKLVGEVDFMLEKRLSVAFAAEKPVVKILAPARRLPAAPSPPRK